MITLRKQDVKIKQEKLEMRNSLSSQRGCGRPLAIIVTRMRESRIGGGPRACPACFLCRPPGLHDHEQPGKRKMAAGLEMAAGLGVALPVADAGRANVDASELDRGEGHERALPGLHDHDGGGDRDGGGTWR